MKLKIKVPDTEACPADIRGKTLDVVVDTMFFYTPDSIYHSVNRSQLDDIEVLQDTPEPMKDAFDGVGVIEQTPIHELLTPHLSINFGVRPSKITIDF